MERIGLCSSSVLKCFLTKGETNYWNNNNIFFIVSYQVWIGMMLPLCDHECILM